MTMKNPTASEIQNAANQLAGMIYGVSLDGMVSRSEYEALKAWCRDHEPLCEIEGFQKLHNQINPIIHSGIVTSEEIEDIRLILEKFLSENGTPINENNPNLFFINGVFQGILANGEVNKQEAYKLEKWLEKNVNLRSQAPYDALYLAVHKALENGKINHEESNELRAILSKIVSS
jgi:hypothetical protein